MASVFTKIMDGEIPGRFVWRDDRCAVFSTIAPIAPGHVMVVPQVEIDHWIDLDPDLAAHLMRVAQVVGRAQMETFAPARIGVIVAGMEVPHTHIHVIPIQNEADLDFARADADVAAEELDASMGALRSALVAAGHSEAAATS